MKSLAKKKKKITHVVFLLDASGSMAMRVNGVRKNLAKLFDDLSAQATKTGIETRVHIHTFGYGKRTEMRNATPKEASSYKYDHRNEGTALIDSTIQLVDELGEYESSRDDVSFLVYVLTDGAETEGGSPERISRKLRNLSDDYTMAILVPDEHCQRQAERFGFPSDNIQIWDVTSEAGIGAGGQSVLCATQSYYTMRSMTTQKSTKQLFKLNEVNKTEVKQSLEEVPSSEYDTLIVRPYYNGMEIKEFVEKMGQPYRLGSAYYQLTKPEKIQAGKIIAVRDKQTGKMFSGVNARKLLGLPNAEIKVAAADFAKFDVFVQSHSTNRHLVGDTHLIVFK